MLSFWKFFLKKKQFTVLLIIASIIAGLGSLMRIPKESAPEVKIAVGIVSTIYPGASAEDVEKLVTNPMESGLANVPKLDKITSSSRDNISVVSVQFTSDADIDKSIRELKDAVDKVRPELPNEAQEPSVAEVNFADQPVLIFSLSSDLPPQQFNSLGLTVKDELKNVSGVGKVSIVGNRKRETQVVVSKDRLVQYNLSLLDVMSAIQSANSALPVGTITTGNIDYSVAYSGDILEPSEVSNIPIVSAGGNIVYVRDVALVSDGVEKTTSLSRISVDQNPSEQAITFNVYKTSGSNILEVVTKVEDKIAELKSGILKDSQTLITFNLGEQTRKDITHLSKTGLETMVLVALVLFLTLGWREAIIASISVPFSFLIAFIALYASGHTINFMTLFSLILAIGILVDTGIVVIEAIHTRITKYPTKEDAAIATLDEYAWPLIAGTTATIAVFVPLFFLSGIVGKFIASIPFTIILVLVASIIVALGFIPYLAVKYVKKTVTETGKFQERISDMLRDKYMNFMRGFLGNSRKERFFIWGTLLLFIVSVTLPATGLVKSIFFGQEDQTFIYIQVEKTEGTPFASTDLTIRKIEEVLYTNPYVESFASTVGASSAFSDTGPSGGGKLGNITVNLDKTVPGDSTVAVESLRADLADIKDAKIRVLQLNNGPPSSAPIVIKFLGDDLGDLEIAADKAHEVLKNIPHTRQISASTENSNTEFAFAIDRAKAAEYGVSSQYVAQILRMAVNGLTATVIKHKDDDIDVVVKLALDPDYTDTTNTTHATAEDIMNIQVATSRGMVPLGNFLSSRLERNTTVIQHEERMRLHTLNGYLTKDGNATVVMKAFEEKMKEVSLPAGITMKTGGESEDVTKSFTDMMIAFIASIVLMFAILVLEFNSFRYAAYLILIVIYSLIGVFFGLFLTGQPLGFTSMLGVIALGGVIINHAIILMDSYRRFEEREEFHHDIKEVVIEASATRFRPIMLTTITTVLGMIPLAFSSVLWGPFAFAIMFGLSFSLILTLVFIPTLYYRHVAKTQAALKR